MQIVVAHPGTQHSWQTAYALQQLGRLKFYATSIFYQPERWPYRIERYLPAPLKRLVHNEFRRFQHDGLDPAFVRAGGIHEWLERIARRGGLHALAARLDRMGNRQNARMVNAALSGRGPAALWTYDMIGLDQLLAAKARGHPCILDRTTGDGRAYNAIMGEVFDRYPEFFPSGDFRISRQAIDRSQAEYELADVVLAGSPFAARTVSEHGGTDVAQKIRLLNYCYDDLLFGNQAVPVPRPADGPLRFLFVGQAAARKGIHLALKAIARIPASAASLTIVGSLRIPPRAFAPYADRVRHIPHVPRADIPAIMRAHDVLIFPSYFEGAAITVYEALAAGLGVIQSSHTDIVVTPETGLLLPDHSEEAVYDAMMEAVENRERVAQWRAAAPLAARRYSFANYRDNIAKLLADMEL